MDNDVYDVLLQQVRVKLLKTVLHGKQQASYAPSLASVWLLGVAYSVQEMTLFMPEIMAFIDVSQGASTAMEHALVV